MKKVAIKEVVRTAASLRTWDRRLYINLGDGALYERRRGVQVPLAQVYPSIRTVFNSQHQPIARRQHPDDDLKPVIRVSPNE